MATVLEHVEQRLDALPRAEQAPRRELLGRVAEVVIETPLDQLVLRVEEFAEQNDRNVTWSLAEGQKRNVERLLADQASLIKQTIRGSLVREGMNISRQRLHQLVTEGRVLAIQFQEGAPSLYPFWQFVQSLPVQPIFGLAELLVAARQAGMGEIELHFFMVEPNDRLDGRAPFELIANGELDRVIDVLSSFGLGPF